MLQPGLYHGPQPFSTGPHSIQFLLPAFRSAALGGASTFLGKTPNPPNAFQIWTTVWKHWDNLAKFLLQFFDLLRGIGRTSSIVRTFEALVHYYYMYNISLIDSLSPIRSKESECVSETMKMSLGFCWTMNSAGWLWSLFLGLRLSDHRRLGLSCLRPFPFGLSLVWFSVLVENIPLLADASCAFHKDQYSVWLVIL